MNLRIVKNSFTVSPLTYFTVGPQETGAGAIADVAVPTLLTQACIATGRAAAALLHLPRTEAADPQGALDLSQAAHITALAINEEVTHAAYVAVVEQRRPHLRWQNKVRLGLGQATQVHVTVQVQNLTALWGAEGHATAVDRY